MYYEEKMIDGVLHCRSMPDGDWRVKPTQDKDNALLPDEIWAGMDKRGDTFWWSEPHEAHTGFAKGMAPAKYTRANVPQPEAVWVDEMLAAINKCENIHQLAGFLSTMDFTGSDPHTALAFLEASRNLLKSGTNDGK